MHKLLLKIGVSLAIALSVAPAQAAMLELGVFKAIDSADARCPERVVVTEESKPYEGGYSVNGQAKLSGLAGSFAIGASDAFSVTWVATLKPEYQKCRATGRIVKYGNAGSDRHSHLRLRFTGGKVFLILDMTGMRDANGFTPAILKKSAPGGNPTWSWAGSD
jgi:hypothetical protein